MTITYDDIINSLCNKKTNFYTNLNIMKYASEFDKFNNIFDNSFYRYGIYQYNDEYSNISFISSILYCIDPNYFIMSKDDLFSKINQMKLNSDFDIVKNLKINIIIFDFKNNKIKSLYDGEYFNPFVETVLLANNDNYWEPICCKENKTFSYISNKSNVFKHKILTEKIEYIDNTKDFILNDNIDEIMTETFGTENNLFTTKNKVYENLTKSKLNKMKKEEIIEIINDLNLEIKNIKPTKKDLINIIFNK